MDPQNHWLGLGNMVGPNHDLRFSGRSMGSSAGVYVYVPSKATTAPASAGVTPILPAPLRCWAAGPGGGEELR